MVDQKLRMLPKWFSLKCTLKVKVGTDHLAYDVFSKYRYFRVNLVLFPTRFLEWEFHSDCAIS